MLKKFNKFMWLSIGVCVMFLLAGILLVFFPATSMKIISYIIALTLVLCGIALICDYNSSILLTNFLPTGILSVILGLVILLYPNSLSIIVPIVVGVWVIINSLLNIQLSWQLKKVGYSKWLISLILSIILIICGIIIAINPEISSIAFTTLFGILLIVYAISDIINIVIFKSRINELSKIFK